MGGDIAVSYPFSVMKNTTPCLVPAPIGCKAPPTIVTCPPVPVPNIGLVAVPTVTVPGSNVKAVPYVMAVPDSGWLGMAPEEKPSTVNVPEPEPTTVVMIPVVLNIDELVQPRTVINCPGVGALVPGAEPAAMDHPYVATPTDDIDVDVMSSVVSAKGCTTTQLEFHPPGVAPLMVKLLPPLMPTMAVVVVTVAKVISHVPVLPGPFGPVPPGPPYRAFPVEVY